MGICGLKSTPKVIPQPDSYAVPIVTVFPGQDRKVLTVTVPRLQIEGSGLYKKRKTNSRCSSVSSRNGSASRRDSGEDGLAA